MSSPNSHHQILSPMPSPKRGRGRPPGTGSRQRLEGAGELMNDSAGHAFATHVITVDPGEDIVSTLLSFSKLRQRVLCIISGTGKVSSATICQPGSSLPTLSFQGSFDILTLQGSYLVNEEAGPTHRIGGISVSLSHPDGGPPIAGPPGTLIAANSVRVVAGSFVYTNAKAKAIKQGKNKTTPESEPSLPPAIELTMEAAQAPLDFSALGWLDSDGGYISTDSTNHSDMTDIGLTH